MSQYNTSLPDKTWLYERYKTTAINISLGADQYPTAISLSGKIHGEGGGRDAPGRECWVAIYLCDTVSQNNHLLVSAQVPGAKKSGMTAGSGGVQAPWYDNTWYDLSNVRQEGEWKDLTGKNLALRIEKSQDNSSTFIDGPLNIVIQTAEVPKNVSAETVSGGTVVIEKTSLSRKETTIVAIKPDEGVTLLSLNATKGTLLKKSEGRLDGIKYWFTMPEPAEDVILTPKFDQITYPITTKITVDGKESTVGGVINCPNKADRGSVVNVSQTPANDDYLFLGWDVTGAEIIDGAFTMPKQDVTITAKYIKHAITWEKAEFRYEQENSVIKFINNGYAVDNFLEPLMEMRNKTTEGSDEYNSLTDQINKRQIHYFLYKEQKKLNQEFDADGICRYQTTGAMQDVLFRISAENVIQGVSSKPNFGESIYVTYVAASTPVSVVYGTVGFFDGSITERNKGSGLTERLYAPVECEIRFSPKGGTVRTENDIEAIFENVDVYVFDGSTWNRCSLKSSDIESNLTSPENQYIWGSFAY